MDVLSVFDYLVPDIPGEPFLVYLRNNLKCFFLEDFTVSYNSLCRIIEDYNKIPNPDFFIEITMFNTITVIFVERKNNNA